MYAADFTSNQFSGNMIRTSSNTLRLYKNCGSLALRDPHVAENALIETPSVGIMKHTTNGNYNKRYRPRICNEPAYFHTRLDPAITNNSLTYFHQPS